MREEGARIHEGQPVKDSLGRPVGEVGAVLVGASTRGPRFLTIRDGLLRRRDRLVPCEAIERVDIEGDLRLNLTRDVVDMLPEYDGAPPDEETTRHAYTLLGGLRGDPASGTRAHSVPFDGTARAPENRMPPHVDIIIEEILILPPDERERQGYRDEWLAGGGPGP